MSARVLLCGCSTERPCQEHAPKPTDPLKAILLAPYEPKPCCLCHRVGRVDDLTTGKDGITWHRRCAEDNS
jgi:hypothetical protein